MRTCRFCEEVMGDRDKICGNCGYNPQTDTMTSSFVKREKKAAPGQKQRKINPGVKTFMFWGIMVMVVSLGVKYQGKIGDIIWKARNKPAPVSGKVNQNKTTGLVDVRSYKAPVNKTAGKSRKIEGIFYDPQGKSYVVINGQLVSEQMNFGDMVVKKINHDSVEVVQDGKEKVLRVNQVFDISQ